MLPAVFSNKKSPEVLSSGRINGSELQIANSNKGGDPGFREKLKIPRYSLFSIRYSLL